MKMSTRMNIPRKIKIGNLEIIDSTYPEDEDPIFCKLRLFHALNYTPCNALFTYLKPNCNYEYSKL